jgi:ammonium transporter, Amt family
LLFGTINKFIPVRVTDVEQTVGLDLIHHGEVARQS